MPSVVRIHLRPHDIAEVAQLIEHQPSKLRVASLSLVFRSKNNKEGVSAGCILFYIERIMKPVFLVGYMGAGKTTVGKVLAEQLGWEFMDLDVFIENRRHKSIKEIFDTYGEEEFRRIESRLLKEVRFSRYRNCMRRRNAVPFK